MKKYVHRQATGIFNRCASCFSAGFSLSNCQSFFSGTAFIFLCLVMVGPISSFCAVPTTIRISGSVKDSVSATPIPDAVVYLEKSHLADTTQTTGSFTIAGTPLPASGQNQAMQHFQVRQTANGAIRVDLAQGERVTVGAYSLRGQLLQSENYEWGPGRHAVELGRQARGVSILKILIGQSAFAFKAAFPGAGSGAGQSRSGLPADKLIMAKQAVPAPVAPFADTIIVSAAGYDQRKIPVTKQVITGLKIKLLKTPIVVVPRDSVVDIDGNVYATVKIGSQTWMAENLKAARFSDSAAIPLVIEGAQWETLSTPGCCWYDNDTNKGKTFGALYNWYAVDASNPHKLAPKGWHVATDSDWVALENYLGGWSVAGGKMKETGSAHWRSPNTGATNESGFTALPGGKRTEWFDAVNNQTVPGVFLDLSYVGWWWSSTKRCCRNLQESDVAIFHSECVASFGASVRCVKD
jgi:uncharacterized protein (TIGR02145 family)